MIRFVIPFPGSTLFRYLARQYGLNLLVLFFVLLGIVGLFDTIELMRRAAKFDDISAGLILKMEAFRLPGLATTIAPFVVLFSGLFTFWQLGRRQELVVLRSSGISVWQFISPMVAVALSLGVLFVTVLDPVGAAFYSRFDTLEKTWLKRENASVIALFDEGIWLRQATEDGHAILHAAEIEMPDWRLHDVMVLFFDGRDDSFSRRLDAPLARLQSGNWVLKDAILNTPGHAAQKSQEVAIPTRLTTGDIEESFSKPETMGFWNLPSYIRTLESTGFDSTRLRVHFQHLLSLPFLFAAMVLLAASVAMRQTRQGQNVSFILIGVTSGFAVFFFSNFLQALGISHQLPVFLAAWSPSFLLILTGVSVLLSVEDG